MQNKNLKLKLSLCGLALTSFLALNVRSTVHADTVQNGNANNNAITWNSDSDDSQVVKGEPQQQTAPQSVQKQAKQSTVQASQSQPVQNKKIMVSDVSSTSVSQKRAETGIVRQSNVDTSTVNRLNANKSQANIKVSNVQDVAQAPIQKQKVAQFNQGSKIYSLNNSSTLSKNNGDGYVITNAGTYNGRAVDIGVTVNNVQDNQGSYTTKWSNGDKADVTGKVDNDFNYQNSVLVTSNPQAINIDDVSNRGVQITRNRNVTETTESDFPYAFIIRSNSGSGGYHSYDDITDEVTDFMSKNENLRDAIRDAVRFVYDGYNVSVGVILDSVSNLENKLNKADEWTGATDNRQNGGGKGPYADDLPFNNVDVLGITIHDDTGDEYLDVYGFRANPSKKYTISKKTVVPVTDHLQVDQVNNGSLNYNYTVGLYDAQTGDLITDLKPEYKSKAGKSATNQDTVMNNAIKAKIQAINANKASVAYTGTVANDDVAFYKETRAVNPQDQSLHKSATRIISVNLPDDQGARDRYKGVLDANNQVVQTINFTRTGVENVVTGHVAYGAWQGPSSFGAVTLPDIPGYTMTMN